MVNPFDKETYSSNVPDCIIKGRHVGWKIDYTYTDTDYSIKAVLDAIDGDTTFTINGTNETINGTNYWVFEATKAITDAWDITADTEFRLDIILTEAASSNEAIIATDFIRVFLNNSDRRNHAEIMLAKIDSILQKRADADVDSYSIKSRQLSKIPIKELLMWRDYYANEIRKIGGSTSAGNERVKRNTVRVRFE